jgi:hypothetical protein
MRIRLLCRIVNVAAKQRARNEYPRFRDVGVASGDFVTACRGDRDDEA